MDELAATTVTANAAALAGTDYIIVAIYLLCMLALGAVISSRIKGFKDYFLADGALTTPLLVCTLVSSYYGLDVTFGTSETSYYYGIATWCWFSLPYYIFIAFAALVIAPRLRRYGGAMTVSDIVEFHYGMTTRAVGAVACFIYSAPIVAMAGMMTLMAHLGLPVGWGLAVTIGVCALYTTMGGLWADVLSDTVQFVLMCVSLAIAIPLAIDWVGGWSFVTSLPIDPISGEPHYLRHHGGRSYWMLTAWALSGLTVLIEPAFYQRVFAAQDDKAVSRALLVGIFLWSAYDWGVTIIGMIAQAAVQQGLLAADLEGKTALLAVCAQVLPVGLRGLMIGGILAAAMSTIDSYSLLASANIVYDIYRPLINPRASERQLVVLTRLGVFVVMIAAAVISMFFVRMRDTWQFMTSVMTSAMLVPVLGALFSKPKPLAGLWAASAGLAGLIVFYVLLFTRGEFNTEEEVFVWQIGAVELWQDYAVLCALPVSFLGFQLGNRFDRSVP